MFTWHQLVADPIDAAGAAYASSAAATDVNALPNPVLQANQLRKRSMLRLTAHGRFSNTGTPTLELGFYYGGVSGVKLASAGAVTTVTAAANWPFRLEALAVVRADGASGSIVTSGFLLMPASLTQFQAAYALPSVALPNAQTIDTTAAKSLTVGATWGTSNASNTLTLEHFSAEIANN